MAKPSSNCISLDLMFFKPMLLAVLLTMVFSALSTFSVAAQRTVLGARMSDDPNDAISSPVSIPARANESAVHHIRTKTKYDDGYSEVRHGTGFVVGHRFITVYHNIDVLLTHGAYERHISLGDVTVKPVIVDAANDIAIFNVPDSLCATWCNDREPISIGANLEQSQPIGWYEFVSPKAARQWRQARIIEVIFKNYRGPAADTGAGTVCDSDVVIAVDKPFYPGSSGGPVWDLASNNVLGVVQGSFVRESGEQVGYYKPFSCVQSLLTGRMGPVSVELVAKGQAF